jgi:hypothetical protein
MLLLRDMPLRISFTQYEDRYMHNRDTREVELRCGGGASLSGDELHIWLRLRPDRWI